MAFIMTGLVINVLGFAILGTVGLFAYNLYQRRMRFRSIKDKYGIPLLPHSFILGHLIIAAKVAMKYPRDIATSIVPYLISTEHPGICNRGYFYLDMWPVSHQMIVVSHPDMMAQFTQDVSFPKHKQMPFEFGPFSHGVDLVTSNGQVWKTWRSIMNPAFSLKNIQGYIPMMLEEYDIFRSKMEPFAASGGVMNMDKFTMALTVDIIGHAVLGARLHAQTTGCEIFDVLKKQIGLLIVDYSPGALVKLLNPVRHVRLWQNDRIMHRLIQPYILDAIRDYESKAGTKTMLNLAVNSYLKEHAAEEGKIDARWINIAIDQFKILLFAGHDTASSTFCFTTALLHNYPEKLAKCREELDSVFGPPPTSPNEVDPAKALISNSPEILNRLVYLTACLKETLRLFGPVSGSVRQATTMDQHLYHPDQPGTPLPLCDFMMFSHQAQSHRDPTYFVRPHDFIPERFLAKPGEELYPRHKFAFRPFEMGARNCIGQEFAMTELRLVLALALREWDFEPVLSDEKVYFGMNLWQSTPSTEITMHPREGMPMRVRRRKQ